MALHFFKNTQLTCEVSSWSFITLTPYSFIHYGICPSRNSLLGDQVRRHLKSAIRVSIPFLRKDVDHLERHQHLQAGGYRDLSYKEQFRRLRDNFIFACILGYGSSDRSLEDLFSQPSCASLRWHYLKLHHRRFRLIRRNASYSECVYVLKSRLVVFWTDTTLNTF